MGRPPLNRATHYPRLPSQAGRRLTLILNFLLFGKPQNRLHIQGDRRAGVKRFGTRIEVLDTGDL